MATWTRERQVARPCLGLPSITTMSSIVIPPALRRASHAPGCDLLKLARASTVLPGPCARAQSYSACSPLVCLRPLGFCSASSAAPSPTSARLSEASSPSRSTCASPSEKDSTSAARSTKLSTLWRGILWQRGPTAPTPRTAMALCVLANLSTGGLSGGTSACSTLCSLGRRTAEWSNSPTPTLAAYSRLDECAARLIGMAMRTRRPSSCT